MIKLTFNFLSVFLASGMLLLGCDKSIHNTNKEPEPLAYMKSGMKVQIGPDETATHFGYDKCPVRYQSWPYGGTTNTADEQCTLLSGISAANVRLIHQDGSISKETWSISEEPGEYGTKIRISRANGWRISAPPLCKMETRMAGRAILICEEETLK